MSETYSDRELLEVALHAVGAHTTAHSGRMLTDHLLGTYELLRSAGCPRDVCVAGGLHSIYGTQLFQAVSTQDRDSVKEIFGEAAERLAYLFATINRPEGLDSGDLHHWQTKQYLMVNAATVVALRLIEAANLLEQGDGLGKYPRILETWGGWLEATAAK